MKSIGIKMEQSGLGMMMDRLKCQSRDISISAWLKRIWEYFAAPEEPPAHTTCARVFAFILSGHPNPADLAELAGYTWGAKERAEWEKYYDVCPECGKWKVKTHKKCNACADLVISW